MDTSCSSRAATDDRGTARAPLTERGGAWAEGSKIDVAGGQGGKPASAMVNNLKKMNFFSYMRQDDAGFGTRIAVRGGGR